MGNDLHIKYKGTEISNIGRKYNYDIDTDDLDRSRSWIISSVVAYATYLMVSDHGDITEELDYLIDKLEQHILVFEENATKYGAKMLLDKLKENKNIEILDDYEIEKNWNDENDE